LTATAMLLTKWVGANSTCWARAVVFVVVLHSRSIVPFCSNGIVWVGVTIVYCTLRFGICSFFLTASTTFKHRSAETPTGFASALVLYENGKDASLAPNPMTPDSFIFCKVSLDWAWIGFAQSNEKS